MNYRQFLGDVKGIRDRLGSDLNTAAGVAGVLLRLLLPGQEPPSERRVGRTIAEAAVLIWDLCLASTPTDEVANLSRHVRVLMRAGLSLAPSDDLLWGKLGIVCTQGLQFDEACDAFSRASELRGRSGQGLTAFEKAYATVSYIRIGEEHMGRKLGLEALESGELPNREGELVRALLEQTRHA